MEKFLSLRTCVLFNKTTKLMNHLGGMGLLGGFWLSGSQGHGLGLCISLVDCHPGTKRLEMSNVEKLQVQPLGNMGSAWII